MGDLQKIVDGLARSTGRAVSAHDSHRQLLAYSTQLDEVDEIRKESILTRKGPSRGYEWAKSFGIETANGPVRVPANEKLGMVERICVPMRSDGKLLGFLWLLDPQGNLQEDELIDLQNAAASGAMTLQQEELMRQIDRGKERELLRDLLSETPDVRTHAVADLIEGSLLVPAAQVIALVVIPDRAGGRMAAKDVSLRNRVERAMESMRERVPMRQALSLMRPDHGVLVLTMSNTETKSISSLAAELHERADDCLRKENDWRALIGVGEFQPAIADVYVSYDQARKAAELAGLLSPATGVAEWARLGVYQTLVDLPADTHGLETLHPGLAKLFAAKDSDVWLQTLEVFLDLAGDARGAAKLLFVNRGTLYHRIHRIEEIAGIDMNNGMDRLALHLGLKLLRLSGTLKTLNPVDP